MASSDGTGPAQPPTTMAAACRSLGLASESEHRLADEVYNALESQAKTLASEPDSSGRAATANTAGAAALLSRVLIPTYRRSFTKVHAAAPDHGDGNTTTDGRGAKPAASAPSSAGGSEPMPMEGVETTEGTTGTTSDVDEARPPSGCSSSEKSAKTADAGGGRTTLVDFAHFLGRDGGDGAANATDLAVASVASYCIDILDKSDCSKASGREFMQGLRDAVIDYTKSQGGEDKTNDSTTETLTDELINLRELLISALKTVLTDVQTSVEATSDFDYLWDSCLVKVPDFASAFVAEGEEERDDERLAANTAAECAFSMASVLTARDRTDRHPTTDGDSSGPSDRRRDFIVASAACIATVCIAAGKKPSRHEQPKQGPEDEEGAEPHPKRRRTGGGKSGAMVANSADGEKENANANTGRIRPRSRAAARRRVENEAVATLSAMVTEGSAEESLRSNLLATLASASNDLLAVLEEVSPASGGTASGLEQARIEDEIRRVTKHYHEGREELQLVPFVEASTSSALNVKGKAAKGDMADERAPSKENALVAYLATHRARCHNGKILAGAHLKDVPSLDCLPFVDCLAILQGAKGDSPHVKFTLIRCQAMNGRSSPEKVGAADETPMAKIAIVEMKSPNELKSLTDDAPLPLSESSVIAPMELNEWINSLFLGITRTKLIKPSARLALYLGSTSLKEKNEFTPEWRDVLIPMLNETFERFAKHFSNFSIVHHGSSTSDTVGNNSKIEPSGHVLVVDENGELNLTNVEIPSDFPRGLDMVLGASLLALYYHSLEAILFDETAREKSASHPKLVLSQPFNRALLSVCCICILKAAGVSASNGSTIRGVSNLAVGPSDAMSVLDLMECTPYGYLKVSESFLRSSAKHGAIGGLPATVRQHVRETDELMLEASLWASPSGSGSSTIINIIQELREEFGTRCWPPAILQPSLPEELADEHNSGRLNAAVSAIPPPASSPLFHGYSYVQYLLRKLLSVTAHRVSSLCATMNIPTIVATQIWIAFRHMLRCRIELLQDRHVDQLIMCTVYGVSKIMGLDKRNDFFSRIIRAYQILNEGKGAHVCQRIIRHVKLDPKWTRTRNGRHPNKPYGSVLDLYNAIYVKKMRKHLLRSTSLRDAAAEWTKTRYKYKGQPDEHSKSALMIAERAANWAQNDRNKSRTKAPNVPGRGPSPVNVPKVPGRAPVRLVGTEFYLKVSSSTDGGVCEESNRPKLWEVSGSEARGIYSFGDPGVKDLTLVNRMISCSKECEVPVKPVNEIVEDIVEEPVEEDVGNAIEADMGRGSLITKNSFISKTKQTLTY